ncbi:MAG: adenylyltransferase/cytidyltransferase family protein [Verrucomicrobiota bacterium]|nr:adenylyltransferase/cytidyltransferase family protein [Verrucomicrobiota bacterium]
MLCPFGHDRQDGRVDWREKIISMDVLADWRAALRATGKKLAATNGCFDILHAGHVNYLASARAQADALLVGLNSDVSVRELKGENRPIQNESDRATVLAALEAVDCVCIFNENRATRFLEMAQPDVYVKGGDYTVDELPSEERTEVQRHGGGIIVIGHVPGQSSSDLAKKIATL